MQPFNRTASREVYRNDWMTLPEETGLTTGSLTALGRLDVAPGMSSQRGWVVLATGIHHGEPGREHEEQDMVSGWSTRSEFEQMVLAEEVTDAPSVAAYARLLLWEQNTR